MWYVLKSFFFFFSGYYSFCLFINTVHVPMTPGVPAFSPLTCKTANWYHSLSLAFPWVCWGRKDQQSRELAFRGFSRSTWPSSTRTTWGEGCSPSPEKQGTPCALILLYDKWCIWEKVSRLSAWILRVGLGIRIIMVEWKDLWSDTNSGPQLASNQMCDPGWAI